MGKGGRFRHGHFRRDQQVQAAEGLFIRRGIRVGAQRVRTGNQNRPQSFGMIGQNLFRHDIGRETVRKPGKSSWSPFARSWGSVHPYGIRWASCGR